MYHALEIQEILLNILHYCGPPYLDADGHKYASTALPALARTCRTFKDPALDLLWEVLTDLSPLARCVPDASHRLSGRNMYSFSRPLTPPEWDILRGYARRIRFIKNFNSGLGRKSIRILSNLPSSEPLFPNLRTLHCGYIRKSIPLLRLPLPSLDSLQVEFENARLFQNSVMSFPRFSPDITRLFIFLRQLSIMPNQIESDYICQWQNLQSLVCPRFDLGADALVHLSHVPALTHLTFRLDTTLPTFDSPLLFSKLNELGLNSVFLNPVAQLLSHTLLPAITELSAFISRGPSGRDFSSLLAGIRTSCVGRTLQILSLTQSFPFTSDAITQAFLLELEDLRPFMEFRSLRHIDIDIQCNVHLTDGDVLVLASAWPRLQYFLINGHWGWKSQGGITPGGLVRLLQACRSLSHVALAFDTRGYTESPPTHRLENLGLALPPRFSIDVLDSAIEVESVPAVITFFSGFAASSVFSLVAWNGLETEGPGVFQYVERWDEINGRVHHLQAHVPFETETP